MRYLHGNHYECTWHLFSGGRLGWLDTFWAWTDRGSCNISHAHTAWTNIHTVYQYYFQVLHYIMNTSWIWTESQKNTKGTWLLYKIESCKGWKGIGYWRHFEQFYCLAKETCLYKNWPKNPLNIGIIFEAACFVLHRFWHKDPPCSQFPDVPVLLLTVLIKQKIVTHSADKTEDMVYTSAF